VTPSSSRSRPSRRPPVAAAPAVVKAYTEARAIRDLGKPTDAQLETFKLDAPKGTIVVTFKDGARTFQIGETVYGTQDRYALDPQSGKAFVLSKEMITNLELGEQSLYLADPRGFDIKEIASVVIEGGGKKKIAARLTTNVEGSKVKTWADGETKKPHPSLGNFVDQLGNLPPTEYVPSVKVETLTPIVKLTYKDADGKQLGTLTLLKGEKPPVIDPNTEIDPANPPRGETEYYVLTEKSRVPALVRKDSAQQSEQNFPVVMSEQPPENTGSSIEPKGNPFGNTPLPKPGATPPADPHGHGTPPANPHGAAAPAAGSATAPAAPATTKPGAATPPAAPAATKPAATPPAAPATTKPAATPPAAPATTKPAATPPAAPATTKPAATPPAAPAATGSAAPAHDAHAH